MKVVSKPRLMPGTVSPLDNNREEAASELPQAMMADKKIDLRMMCMRLDFKSSPLAILVRNSFIYRKRCFTTCFVSIVCPHCALEVPIRYRNFD
jgi:hypothetical protein